MHVPIKKRIGFSLMELVIVLAILIIIMGLGAPVIWNILSDSNISASGDQVRARLADTRAKAIEEGRPWRLAYIASTGTIQLSPEDSPNWGNTDTFPIEQSDLIRDELPPEIILAASHDAIMGASGPGGAGGDWVTIAVFMGDGSARDDSVVYFGKPGMAPMRAQIRGMTGGVTIKTFLLTGGN